MDELTEIVIRGASVLSIAIEEREAALEIAKRSRGTPRVALRLLKRVRDIAEAQKKRKSGFEDCQTCFRHIGHR